MAGGLRVEGLVEDEVGLLEAFLDIAEHERVGRLAHGQSALGGLGEVGVGPLQVHDLQRRSGAGVDVALRAGVRAAGPQAVERVDHEGQRLVVDLNEVDGVGGHGLVDGGDRENRLALVDGLVGERDLGGSGGGGGAGGAGCPATAAGGGGAGGGGKSLARRIPSRRAAPVRGWRRR